MLVLKTTCIVYLFPTTAATAYDNNYNERQQPATWSSTAC